MPNVPKKNSFVSHLTDLQLVAYQDGEMAQDEMEASREHVEACWTCRSRLGVIQTNIDHFLHARKSLLPEPTPFSDSRVAQFQQRLARHAAESAEPSKSSVSRFWAGVRSGSAIMGAHRKAVIASALAACLLVVMFTDVLETRVSADTVLVRAQSYETQHRPGKGLVSKVSVRVERIHGKHGHAKQLGTIVSVHDSDTQASYWEAQSVSGTFEDTTTNPDKISGALLHAVLAEENGDEPLIQYLSHQGWVPDVTAEGFRTLIGARGSSEQSARKSGDVFEVEYPFAAGHPSGISAALLRVNAKDYSPTSLSIVTSAEEAQQDEYRFTRVLQAEEPRSMELAHLAIPASVAGVSVEHGSRNRSDAAPALRAPVPLTYANSRATVQEVEIADALHRVDACLGEEVYLFPMSDGSLLVQGLVDTPARREAIKQSLKSIGGSMRFEVYVPRELKNGSELFNPPDRFAGDSAESEGSAAGVTTTLADLSNASMPLHDRIYKHVSRPGVATADTEKEVAIFSNEVVTHARQAFLHAWALKKLDREFSAERTSGLPAATMRQVERIRQDHQKWIANLAQRQAEMLSGIADTPLAAAISDPATRRDSDTLLRLAREQNDLVRSLFTTSQQGTEASASLTRLMAVLRHMGN
jgi:hypothetical protein